MSSRSENRRILLLGLRQKCRACTGAQAWISRFEMPSTVALCRQSSAVSRQPSMPRLTAAYSEQLTNATRSSIHYSSGRNPMSQVLDSLSESIQGGSVVTLSTVYEDWQQRLSDAFLFPHQGPTVFFLDEKELNRICPESVDAPADLVTAVRSRLSLSGGRILFRQIMTEFRRWQRGSQVDPPPVLPLMAVSVLAATRMRSDALARSTNDDIRLAQTLHRRPRRNRGCGPAY